MNRIYHITVLSYLVLPGLLCAMDESQVKPLALSFFSKINDGKFIKNDQLILCVSGNDFTGLVSYNIETKKEYKHRALKNPAHSIEVTGSGPCTRVAFWNHNECGQIDLDTQEVRLVDSHIAENRSVGSNRFGKLFLYNTGGSVTTVENQMFISEGKEVFTFDFHDRTEVDFSHPTESIKCYPLACNREPFLTGALANNPMIEDEIAYTSHMHGVSIVSIENDHVAQKNYIPVDRAFGYVSGPLRYNNDGSILGIGVCNPEKNLMRSFLIYNFKTKEFANPLQNVLDAVFYPNSSILMLLQGDGIIDFLNFKTEEIIASINQFYNPAEDKDRNLSMTLSPDGKNLFIKILRKVIGQVESKSFLIPVPKVVRTYNKAKKYY